MLAGASASAFWAANMLWDLLVVATVVVLLSALFVASGLPELSGRCLVAAVTLLLMFGPAGLSMTYLLHFWFKVRRTCFASYATLQNALQLFGMRVGAHAG